ncbi:hypothetical protein BDP55DRAFT_179392 [Colletotrichum godetiae]|uniref:Uncharacterized protein n=1 Tax=Colletotrichum godetiae TaxID=1209918 RepID=A0AAJ0AJW1_9PEZI|nr:uncharacterized protein BDP55DRAFT_179392 [Colletotrichum godetiae]KAK1674624.1 hypothetical protein BDP55DRAFT_179392 [Colletotrichum godetiae]
MKAGQVRRTAGTTLHDDRQNRDKRRQERNTAATQFGSGDQGTRERVDREPRVTASVLSQRHPTSLTRTRRPHLSNHRG